MAEQPRAEPRGSLDHVRRNREAWGGFAPEYEGPARRAWGLDEPDWGIFNVPESEVRLLPGDLEGKDAVELGCGTAHVSSWLARRGARPVGVDVTPEQLATARTMQREFDLRFPLIRADAELLPLADGTFDVAISEYGASIWCDPHRWIPEASRVLRPGGELIFLVNGTLLMLSAHDTLAEGPADNTLKRDYFGMHRMEWPDEDSVEFHLGYGDWIRVLRANRFEITDLIEVRPPEDATTRYPYVDAAWARRWPCEEVWKARKLG